MSARLSDTVHALEAAGLSVHSAEPLRGLEDVLQISADGDAAAMRAVLDRQFPRADLLVSGNQPAVPKVFVSDMDSTMIQAECIDELADFAGLKDQIAAITERAMQGELDFAEALTERVRLLGGLGEGAIAQCLAERVPPMPGATTLVATLKDHGCFTVLVTGGFHQFADPVADQLGFERVVANRLAVEHGALTGGLVGDIVDSAVKEMVLRAEAGLRGGSSLATGDGANDIPMLRAATHGIAYHAKPKAKEAAHGYVAAGDLTSVLLLLGIPRADWVEG
ncbi:MAG: phosphoserine phosphatase SerB [Pseudomonadota bacterium]